MMLNRHHFFYIYFMNKKGRPHGSLNSNVKWTKDKLIEFINEHQHLTRTQIRKQYPTVFYQIQKWSLIDLIPKTTRLGHIVGQGPNSHLYQRKKEKVDKPEKPEKEIDPDKREIPSNMYNTYKMDNGNIWCGRCLSERTLDEFPNGGNTICKKCRNRHIILTHQNKDHNPWNVKDTWTNTIVNISETQKFEIGIIVEPKLQDWLTKMGFGFLFKENYIEKHIII